MIHRQMIVAQAKSSKFGKFAGDAALAHSRRAGNKDELHEVRVESFPSARHLSANCF
jgi:hypothetical protein